MPEGAEAAHHGGSGIGKLLQAQTAGLPNWAWLLIIAGGIAAAIIVPNLLGGGAATTPATTDNTGATPTDNTGAGNISSTPDLSSLLGGGGGGTTSLPSNGSYVAPTTDGGTTTTTTPAPVAPTPTPVPTQLQTQNAMQQAAQTPPTTAPSGTPLSNLQKIVNYLSGLGTGATVNQVGTPGHPQSGYVVTGNNVNAGALGALFSGGWSVVKCGTNKYLVKGPGATNVHFGPNCVVTGYS